MFELFTNLVAQFSDPNGLRRNRGGIIAQGGIDIDPEPSFLEPLRPVLDHSSLFLGLLFGAAIAWHLYSRYRANYVPVGPHARPRRSMSNELGSGDLADAKTVKKWLSPNNELDTALYLSDVRAADGLVAKKAKLFWGSGDRNRHVLIIAKTGGGKTTKMILPVLYNDCMCPVRSTVVIDSKPEMWRKLAAMTQKYNPKKKILLFNPLDTARSLSWNILAKVEDDTDAKLIANTIIMATDQPGAKSDSPFFRNNALQVLNSVMVGLLRDPNDRLSMPRIHELVHSGMKNLCDWIEAHPHAIRNSRTFVELARSGSQNADTIMSELSMRLSAWDLHAIRATTFLDEIDLESLISEPTLFIVEFRESEIEMLRPLANVIVIEILRFLTKRAESCPGYSLPRPVGLVIDEFASALGRLPDIHVKLNTLRSRNVSIVAAIQSIAQIKAAYEDKADSVIAGFSTKILMPSLDFQDAEWASKETGQMTIRYKTQSEGSNKRAIDFWASVNKGSQENIQQRAVLTPNEIGSPPDNINTFFMPNTSVFQGHLIPYYKVPELMDRFKQFDSVETDVRLRESPIDVPELYTDPSKMLPPPSAAQVATTPGGETRQPTEEELKAQYLETRGRIAWEETTGLAKEWWEAFETQNAQNTMLLLTVANELDKRKASISDFFLAYVYSNSDNIQANLDYLDQRRAAVTADPEGKTHGLTEDEISMTLEAIKKKLDWENTTGLAKEWWESFEAENKDKPLLVLAVANELDKRQATITEFFMAYVYSNSDNIQANLDYLDYRREQAKSQNAQPTATAA